MHYVIEDIGDPFVTIVSQGAKEECEATAAEYNKLCQDAGSYTTYAVMDWKQLTENCMVTNPDHVVMCSPMLPGVVSHQTRSYEGIPKALAA